MRHKTRTTEKLTAAETRFVKAELKAAAIAAGITDPSDALSLVPMDKIERDADGNPTNAADLMAALKDAKPYLFGVADCGEPQHVECHSGPESAGTVNQAGNRDDCGRIRRSQGSVAARLITKRRAGVAPIGNPLHGA